jgi:hypothetical protein
LDEVHVALGLFAILLADAMEIHLALLVDLEKHIGLGRDVLFGFFVIGGTLEFDADLTGLDVFVVVLGDTLFKSGDLLRVGDFFAIVLAARSKQ